MRVRGNDGRLLETPLGMVRHARWLEEHVGDLEERNRQLEAALEQLRQERNGQSGNASG